MMKEDRLYWLAFSAFPGIGPLRFKLLLDYFGSAQDAWRASEKQLLDVGLGGKLVQRLVSFRPTLSLCAYQEQLEKKHITCFMLSDPQYPKALKEISDAPFVLYVRGTIPSEPMVGVVGTRRITAYGTEVTRKISEGLIAANVTIVSGLAYGVDTVAHQTAVDLGGKTIAVLGCGVDVIYPTSNTRLYEQIREGAGCIMSEFSPGMYTDKGLFPSRNRIISGLSAGIVVTEGTADSGALITAKYAAAQGRDVFAVPGPITSAMSAAPTILLKQGAKLVTSAQDVLEELKIENVLIENVPTKAVKDFKTEEERKIYELLAKEAMHFDVLVQQSGIPAAQLGSSLTVMEMEGKVKSDRAGVYRI